MVEQSSAGVRNEPLEAEADPVSQELVRYALEAAVDEMALTVVRSAYSNTLRDVLDFSTAILDSKGEMVVQGLSLPLHLGAFPSAIGSILECFHGTMKDGDVYALNDPFRGGMHLPDVFMFKPVFISEVLFGFVAIVGHQADIGGRVAGGNACDSRTIYEEGLRIPPVRIIAQGKDVEAFWDFVGINVRLPDSVKGDLRAQLAGLNVGERELKALVARYGAAALKRMTANLLDATELLARREVRSWPDGVYCFTDYLDDNGVDLDKSVSICVRLSVKEDKIDVCFEGSSPQVESSINSSLASTKSAVALAIRAVMGNDIPNNGGLFRLITVHADEGLIVNPKPPAAVAGRALTCFRIVDAVLGALSLALPSRVFAAGDGGITIVTISGRTESGSEFILMDSIGSCWGARPWADGVDAITPISLNVSNIPAEVIEREFPIRIRSHRLVEDSGGAGEYRGGLAQEKVYEFLQEGVDVQVRADRQRVQPYGLCGGGPGAAAQTWIVRNSRQESMPPKFSVRLGRNDLLTHRTAGGGGWGDATKRDRRALEKDMELERVTPDPVCSLYPTELPRRNPGSG